MRSILTGTAECGGSDVRYYLLQEPLGEEAECYGVAVEYGGERAELRDLTPSRGRAEELLERMRRGQVTPVTARDVVEDWLLE
ncbi:MAG: hypothetical protein HFG09_03755 [Oscillibacter sp.]|nr:hypothetical protein [Oscillibacter sp.]